jgi:predicted DNA binding protein
MKGKEIDIEEKNINKLQKYFEGMFNRKLTNQEMTIIRTAYNQGCDDMANSMYFFT